MISCLQNSAKSASVSLEKHFLDMLTNTQIKVAAVAVCIFAALVLVMVMFLCYPKKEDKSVKKIDQKNGDVKVPQPPVKPKTTIATEDIIPGDGGHRQNAEGNNPNSSSPVPDKEPVKIHQPQDSATPSPNQPTEPAKQVEQAANPNPALGESITSKKFIVEGTNLFLDDGRKKCEKILNEVLTDKTLMEGVFTKYGEFPPDLWKSSMEPIIDEFTREVANKITFRYIPDDWSKFQQSYSGARCLAYRRKHSSSDGQTMISTEVAIPISFVEKYEFGEVRLSDPFPYGWIEKKQQVRELLKTIERAIALEKAIENGTGQADAILIESNSYPYGSVI